MRSAAARGLDESHHLAIPALPGVCERRDAVSVREVDVRARFDEDPDAGVRGFMVFLRGPDLDAQMRRFGAEVVAEFR